MKPISLKSIVRYSILVTSMLLLVTGMLFLAGTEARA